MFHRLLMRILEVLVEKVWHWGWGAVGRFRFGGRGIPGRPGRIGRSCLLFGIGWFGWFGLSGLRAEETDNRLRELAQRIAEREYSAAERILSSHWPDQNTRPNEVRFYSAFLSYHQGRLEAALRELRSLPPLGMLETSLGVSYWLGLVYYGMGRLGSAIDFFERQLKRQTSHSADYKNQSYFGLAMSYWRQGDEGKALRYFALIEGETRLRAGFAGGSLALKNGLYRQAYNGFSAYLAKRDPQNRFSRRHALFYKGQSAFLAGMFEEAQASLSQLIKLKVPDRNLYFSALVYLIQSGIALDREELVRAHDLELRKYLRGEGNSGLSRKVPPRLEFELDLFYRRYDKLAEYLSGRIAEAETREERESAQYNYALALLKKDSEEGIERLTGLLESQTAEVADRAQFQRAYQTFRSAPLKQDGIQLLEEYIRLYPDGLYREEAVKILLVHYRNHPREFWLSASALLERVCFDPSWSADLRAQFSLYWGEMTRALGRERPALEHYYRVWELAPGSRAGLEAYYRIGFIYFTQKQYHRALDFFQTVERGNPPEELLAEAQLALASCYAGLKNWEQTLAVFDRILARPRSLEELRPIYLRIGFVHYYVRDYAEAVEYFEKVGVTPGKTANGPDSFSVSSLLALYWKAQALYRQRDYRSARDNFRLVNQLYPDALQGEGYIRAAMAAKSAGDYVGLLEDLKLAQPLIGKDLEAMVDVDFHLIKYSLLLGRDQGALEASSHFLTYLLPAYRLVGEAFLQAAESSFNRGDFERSVAVLTLLEEKILPRLSALSRKDLSWEPFLNRNGRAGPEEAVSLDLLANPLLKKSVQKDFFSFDLDRFLTEYGEPEGTQNAEIRAVEENLAYYLPKDENGQTRDSVFGAFYLHGMVYLSQKKFLEASDYFLRYLSSAPEGYYAVPAMRNIVRVLPELSAGEWDIVSAEVRTFPLPESFRDWIYIKNWERVEDSVEKRRGLERTASESTSGAVRREALYALSGYWDRQGDAPASRRLLKELIEIEGEDPVLQDTENHIILAHLELGRWEAVNGNPDDAERYLLFIAEGERRDEAVLAESFYWLSKLAGAAGNRTQSDRYRKSLEELSAGSSWLEKLD